VRLGLGLSVLAHVALAVVNPGTHLPLLPDSRPRQSGPARQAMSAVRLEITDGPVRRQAAPASPTGEAVARGAPADSLATAGIEVATPGPHRAAPAARSPLAGRSAIERLLAARDPNLWSPPEPRAETNEERALREVGERLARAREEPGFTPAEPPPLAPAGGGFGLRIPFGKKPPPPAQVIPAPARLAAVAVDSARPHGDVLHLHYGSFTLTLPVRPRAGVPFQLAARLPGPRTRATMRVFVDRVAQGAFTSVDGVATATLTIGAPGTHHLLVHILTEDGDPPAELRHVVYVGS
jgi:hypothetical protein